MVRAHQEIVQLSKKDCFLVFDRLKDYFDWPFHQHPEFELNFIENATGLLRRIGDHNEVIKAKELVLVGSNLGHCWEQHHCTTKPIHEITLQFHPSLFETALINRQIFSPIKDMFQRAQHGILFSNETFDLVKPRLIEIYNKQGMDYFLEMLSILHDLATSRNQRILSSTAAPIYTYEKSKELEKLNDFLELNYQRKLTLEEVANELHMSQITFNRFIKRTTGRTFINYLNEIRLVKAAVLLIEGDTAVAEIAQDCGFYNLANFHRTFKKRNGCTPSKYRMEFSGLKRTL